MRTGNSSTGRDARGRFTKRPKGSLQQALKRNVDRMNQTRDDLGRAIGVINRFQSKVPENKRGFDNLYNPYKDTVLNGLKARLKELSDTYYVILSQS